MATKSELRRRRNALMMLDMMRAMAKSSSSPETTLSINYNGITFDISDQPYTLTGAEAPQVVDTADDGTGVYELTPAISDGHITFPDITGLTFTLNDGTQDQICTFEGLISAINAALDGLIIDGITTAGTYTFTIPFGSSTGGSQVSVIINMTVTDEALENALYIDNSTTGGITLDGEYVTVGI